METSLGGKSEREPRFPSPASAVAGGGVLTALPVLLAEGLLAHAGKLHLPPGCCGVRSVLLLLLLQRVERLDTTQPGEWVCVLVLDRCPWPRSLRPRLRQLAEHPERLAAWRKTGPQRLWTRSPRCWWTATHRCTQARDGRRSSSCPARSCACRRRPATGRTSWGSSPAVHAQGGERIGGG